MREETNGELTLSSHTTHTLHTHHTQIKLKSHTHTVEVTIVEGADWYGSVSNHQYQQLKPVGHS